MKPAINLKQELKSSWFRCRTHPSDLFRPKLRATGARLNFSDYICQCESYKFRTYHHQVDAYLMKGNVQSAYSHKHMLPPFPPPPPRSLILIASSNAWKKRCGICWTVYNENKSHKAGVCLRFCIDIGANYCCHMRCLSSHTLRKWCVSHRMSVYIDVPLKRERKTNFLINSI